MSNRVQLLMRCGLGLVFLIFGLEKLGAPEQWVVYLSPALSRQLESVGLPMARFFHLLGVIEILLAAHLLTGWYHRVAAAVAAAELGVIIASVGFDHTGIRDVGLLLGLAVPLTLARSDEWTLSVFFERRGILRSAVWWRHAVWLVLMAGVSVLFGLDLFPDRPTAAEPVGGEFGGRIVAARESDNVRHEPIRPIPRALEVHAGRAALGHRLFNDPRLSGNDTLSCAHCHNLSAGGVDGQKVSSGIHGRTGQVNAPTVLNAALNLSQFWDGRADSLQAQVDGPVTAPEEMGGEWTAIVAKLKEDSSYRAAFGEVFGPRGLTHDTIVEAIAQYERTLLTPDSRFDRWLRGDEAALSAEELSGYRLFKQIGCVACHQGALAGGNMYQTMGKFGDYFRDRGGEVTRADLGRYNVTQQDVDRHKFKVPGLRNVELTAPYFHDGSARTLDDAVRQMGRYQLGRPLNTTEVHSIVGFLKTLTGTGVAK